MPNIAYNISLKGYVRGLDFGRSKVDKELTKIECKQVNVLFDRLGGSLSYALDATECIYLDFILRFELYSFKESTIVKSILFKLSKSSTHIFPTNHSVPLHGLLRNILAAD